MTDVVLVGEGLSKRYRRGPETVHALTDVSFRLSGGEFVGLVGPSGSGKTTLLNLVIGWEHPDAGSLRWGDRGSSAERAWRDLAIVPQRLGLVDELTIRENVALPVRLTDNGAPPARVEEALEQFGLTELADRLPAEVSLGEQQRAALARALVLRPLLVLADEPTGHQDEQWSQGVISALEASCAQGTTCLVATHDAEAVERVHRVLRLADGRLVQ